MIGRAGGWAGKRAVGQAPDFSYFYDVLSFLDKSGAAASSLGSAVSCRVEGRAIDTALGQCFIPNSSHQPRLSPAQFSLDSA